MKRSDPLDRQESTGRLYLCATPIGNLEDITLRALRVLKEATVIAAEDTRQTRKLLEHYGIKGRLVSFHEHNQVQRTPELMAILAQGGDVVLVTDAGTPMVSDPGLPLVKESVRAGVQVIPIPGPSAAITALMVAGLETERFVFEGFLPRKGPERRRRLASLAAEERTSILYESPHRLRDTLEDLAGACPGRRLAVARELTKVFEEVWRGTTEEAQAWAAAKDPRGEYTLVLEGASGEKLGGAGEQVGMEEALARVSGLVGEGVKKTTAIKTVAKETGLNRQDLYRWLDNEK